MAIYLVDFENVKSDGLNGINNLSSKDRVYIFYSVNADKITFSMHKKMVESEAKTNFVKAEVGTKNSLDFQLVTYLGYLINENKTEDFILVSNDNGYNAVVTFWQKKNYKVNLASDLSGTNMKQKKNSLLKQVMGVVEDKKEAELLTDYILKYKTKIGLNNAIVKVYGTTKGGKLYNQIKSLIQDKKGN